MRSRPLGGVDGVERDEPQQRPLVVVRGHQPATEPLHSVQIFRAAIDVATGLGAARQRLRHLPTPHPLGHRHHTVRGDQFREFGTRWLGHPRQVGPRPTGVAIHQAPPG